MNLTRWTAVTSSTNHCHCRSCASRSPKRNAESKFTAIKWKIGRTKKNEKWWNMKKARRREMPTRLHQSLRRRMETHYLLTNKFAPSHKLCAQFIAADDKEFNLYLIRTPNCKWFSSCAVVVVEVWKIRTNIQLYRHMWYALLLRRPFIDCGGVVKWHKIDERLTFSPSF